MEELQGILKGLQDRQTKGLITEVSAAGVRTMRDAGRNNQMNSRVELEILRVRYSLHLRSAGTDSAATWPDPYAERVRRTRARYTFS